ncbi:hypothetical protein BGW36DRAFT_288913 [Talaromyces proteolyticus]|uniref:Uncharacterized protein n=1 Tax=Talaromyces proteolyticus TaxID=1131652 RepID=A0AAD4L0D3_9EURO|nr:uncharacterized protein BGW36DRAFT_288913 [Talaromyces proteolyticus]KAH8703185.1 hypothetical protein BGW36DRAFT_288913 [Talaromyces proteolyticus]
MATIPAVQQISLSLSLEKNAIAQAASASSSRLERDLKTIRDYVEPIVAPAQLPVPLDQRFPPFSISVSRPFAKKIESIHQLLDRALVNIVERWHTDLEANFPSRMPLEPHEEDLLRWISSQCSGDVATRTIPRFSERYGMWRTDFLIEKGHEAEAKICEINARIPYNGFFMAGLHEESSRLLGAGKLGFEIPNNYEVTKKTIIDCFDRSKPLYHIHKKWPGVDSRVFGCEYTHATGQDIVHVEPSELQIQQDEGSPTGWILYFQPADPTEKKQKIEQCTLELFQEELRDIEPQILKQLATCCVNDFRNILLLHDKRILGIVQEEISNLVQQNILDANEARVLHNGIAETAIPGSKAMKQLLEKSHQDPLQRYKYIVKPVRDASCNGIRLGEQFDKDEWIALLERFASHPLQPSEDAYVVQKLADHLWCDIVRHDVHATPKVENFHLIGSCHMINSKLFVFGPWRIGHTIHVGLSSAGMGIVMSCVLRPDGLEQLDERKEE